ncbi:phosphocholine-specific phospholipase C [Pseudoduganella albidiflava]|uniref:phospholipase C n=1 Tax=Pseudoduganella albidiflava TaxID=321983 RepID=A0A411X010_9BURK|nr:phospholipase C, phosphocholine-specific [Pseudoduganella albidiflava]QBI02347.1 phospholipase C, phosphocholine-specific [Pseudoduganella albidiflava]GGY43502.1 non-hemolytic phospholipase C [Pseudoduganella albidiflava]
MTRLSRRRFLGGTAAAGVLGAMSPLLREALAVPARRATGTLADVRHVVILMQENRSFDHYFGTLAGVRGFGDRMAIPLRDGRTVWQQHNGRRIVMPYRLDARAGNAQPALDLPHTWPDAQAAWDDGRLNAWPRSKTDASMAYYTRAELPIQFALAEAFTLCDAYHCSLQGGTNPNRLFLMTGTNDPSGRHGGPAIDNRMEGFGPPEQGFTWATYPERLEAAGVSWKVYTDMADNYDCNMLTTFRTFREAHASRHNAARPNALADKGISSTLGNATLDGLRDDVVNGRLPQVSWVISPRLYSEHPGPSTPVQGGAYTLQVLEALLADPEVWSGTVFLQMYDENDAFFDHVPPPAPPALLRDGTRSGKSTVPFGDECHGDGLLYGLGPRVPMVVMSPWSKGGWVNSEVFDHTSVLRFLERRFGVAEPNISAWRRAVCGDLTSCFDFASPDAATPRLPVFGTAQADAERARQRATPAIDVPVEGAQAAPRQEPGTRPSRALPYRLEVRFEVQDARLEAPAAPGASGVPLTFVNSGTAGAVFHVYDRLRLGRPPRRYTVEAGKELAELWTPPGEAGAIPPEAYDLWILGPNGFHRALRGSGPQELAVHAVREGDRLALELRNTGTVARQATLTMLAYADAAPRTVTVAPGGVERIRLPGPWYDAQVESNGAAWRFAGRVETGFDGTSDPAMAAGQ